MKFTSLEEYRKVWKESIENPEGFWSKVASELVWFKKWDKVLDYRAVCP